VVDQPLRATNKIDRPQAKVGGRATNLAQALQLAMNHRFDAVVVGSKLRDATGIEVLRLLADRFPEIPKIFVVPPEGEEAALEAMESGAMSYIVKTPRYTELLPAIVNEHIEEARNRRRLAETQQIQAQVVTERKTAEERLSQSETRLRMILQQAPVLLWSTDKDLRVTSAMGGGFRSLDTSRNQERGLTLFEYFNVPDEDIEPIASHRRALTGESVATQIEWQGRNYDVHIEPLRSPEGTIAGTIGVAFDVSERTRTEETLRRSEERFRLLGRATTDVVWDWDLQTDGMWVNENVSKVFGYVPEEVEPTGTWWTEHVHPEDRERIVTGLEALVRSGGTTWAAEYRFRRRDGTYATLVERGYVLHDAAGHPVRVIGSSMDMSQRRRAEAIQAAVYRISEAANAAKDLPELYRQIHTVVGGLMPATNFYIALHDEEAGTLVFPYFVDEEEGPPPPQALGRGLTEYVLRTGRPLLASPEVFDGLVRGGEVVSVGPPSVDWVGAPLVSQGKTIGVMVVQSYTEGVRFAEEDRGILTFVSEQIAMAIERKRTQEGLRASADRYRLLFDQSPLSMWVFDLESLRFLAVNEAAVLHYGYSREEFLAMTIKDIRPPEDVPGLLDAVAKTTQGISHSGVWRHRKKDGAIIQAEISSHAIPFDGRSAQLVLAHDVTERKAMERRLAESERLATMGQLAGFIAHELNTPLTSISLLTSAATKRVKDEVALEKLNKINAERQRAAGIIRELLSLSKSRQINAVDTDLRSVVASAVEQARKKRKKGVSLDVEAGDGPVRATVDPLQIQEVLLNLIKNALDATAKGSVHVRVDERPDAFAIVVSDTGTGMSQDVLGHLFEPFYTTKPHGEGIGLGLLLSKHIVTGHGGTLEVSSELGIGSTFTVLLPRRDVA